MATVTVPPEFFRGELKVYSDWQAALARELFQNSVDAGATQIDVSFVQQSDSETTLVFQDNGTGMDRDTLENVFFALGRTTKAGLDTVGGFGRARIITCFAQRSYRIYTSDVKVSGEGGSYTIDDVSPVPGCRFEIDLIENEGDNVYHGLRRFLALSSIPATVSVDGVVVTAPVVLGRAKRVLRDASNKPWAKIYTEAGGGCVVRVNGLFMYRDWLSYDQRVVVELEPSQSRTVLNATRGGLVEPYDSQLSHFLEQLVVNQREAFKPDVKPVAVLIPGNGFINQTYQNITPGMLVAASPPQGLVEEPVTAADTLTQNMASPTQTQDRPVLGWAVHPETPMSSGFGFDVFMLAEHPTSSTKRQLRSWNPTNWDTSRGQRRRKLLLTWKTAVEIAFETLAELHGKALPVSWAPGWVFDENVAALHCSVEQGSLILLNPIDQNGRIRYNLSLTEARQELLVVAAHEACHTIVAEHNERFANLLTQLVGALDMRAADRRLRSIT